MLYEQSSMYIAWTMRINPAIATLSFGEAKVKPASLAAFNK
jgi:hypothetical protein